MIILILWLAIPLAILLYLRVAGGSRPARRTATAFEWDLFESGPDRHAIPHNDGQRHRASADCPCAPGDEPVEHLDHTYGQLYVHHQTAASQRA